MTYPAVTIVVTTYFPNDVNDGPQRRGVALAAISSWAEHLRYRGPIRLHIADDGSAFRDWPFEASYSIQRDWNENWRSPGSVMAGEWLGPDSVSCSRQERHGVGASLNAGFDVAHADGGLALYAVDDWELLTNFDLPPWVDAMVADPTVGMVRFFPHPDLTGRITMFPSGHGLRLDRHHFAFGHRPALYHPRMREAYGRFAEDVNAYECERLYNERFRDAPGPDIVLALPEVWRPIPGSIELAGIDPREG